MAYNKKNIYERIIKIQNITLEHKEKGATQKWIYENVIRPQFFISRSTYYKYLGSEAKRLLKQIHVSEKQQLELNL